MTMMFAKALVALPIVLAALAGSAAAQSQGRDGGGGIGGEGGGSGVAQPMNCLTGAYCPPMRRLVETNSATCDQIRVREPIPGTSRYRVVYRCATRR